LGHVVNAIYVWGMARAHDGRVVLRIEDHDRSRCRPEYEQALLDDLDWLGLRPRLLDAQPAWRQSAHTPAYDDALAQLRAQGHALFWCECSRRDIQATAPAPAGAEVPYPMTCAARGLAQAPGRSLRLALGEGCEIPGRLPQAPRARAARVARRS
jgi:glutamyl/glutaminyl-tRNA synthetase